MITVDPDIVEQADDVKTLITSMNEKLTSAGTGNAELAFGMSCGISIIPIGILLLVLYIVGLRGWAGFGLVILIGVLLATAISTFLASRARTGAIQQAYDREIEPQIFQYLRDHNLDADEFQQTAVEILSPNAPLLKYFTAEITPADIREE